MSTYTKIKTLPLSLFNNAEYLSFMNHVLDLANGNSGGGDSESPDEISLLTGSDGIPELGLTKEFLDTYEADLLAMADVVDESRTSQETEQMTLHDTNRDNLAIYIITRISRAGTLPLEAERDAGKYLYKIIKPYNGIARLPMAQETAKIKGLLLDLRKDENKPYVTTLGLDAYLAELDNLDKYIRKEVESVPKDSRILVTAHDAFAYFARDYGFEVKGIQGISTASEAGTSDISTLAAFIADHKIKAVFVESSVPHKTIESLQAAVKARGFDVSIGGELYSDSLGGESTKEGTYIGMYEHNIKTITEALR